MSSKAGTSWREAKQAGPAPRIRALPESGPRGVHPVEASRGEAQAQLYRTSRFLDSVIQHLPAMLFVVDVGTLAYLRVNKAAEAIFDRPAESLIGLTGADVLPPERAKWLTDHYRIALSTRQPVEVPQVPMRFPDGRWRVLKAAIVPIADEDGKPVYLLGIFEDITGRLKANADLHRKTREADDANRAKSAFLATMSHEIRTPMNGVVGMLEVLQRTQLTPEQRAMTDTIRESAMSLMEIVDDILDFSKIEAGKLELERAPFSIAALMESVTDALAPVAQRRGVQLLSFSDPAIAARVASDQVRLRQILLNLADNAVKFSSGLPDRRGRVMLRADVVDEDDDSLQIRFQVADNGIGMTAETASMLFQPFTQAESSTTRRHGGTGLGLSICQRLASLFGGRVEISSLVGQGSVFSVVLNFVKAGELEPVEWRGALRDLEVLIHSPDADTAEVLRSHATLGGARVSVIGQAAGCAATGQPAEGDDEVLRLPAGFTPRPGAQTVLVLDRPDLPAGGRAVIDAIRRRWQGTGVRIVLLERGRRQRARMLEPELVSLDLDAMRRAAFLRALALVAGKAPSEASRWGPASQPAGAVASIRMPATAAHVILVAEDNLTNQKVLGYQLELLGYKAEFAANGREALARWQAGGCSLLLTDCHMPEMDGFELTAAIRLREQGLATRTPIIAITANALKGEAQRCIGAGMDAYLAKPLGLDRLREALDRWLQGCPIPVAAGPLDDVPDEAGKAGLAGAQGEGAVPAGSEPVMDHGALGRILASTDTDLLREFMLDFLEHGAATVRELQAARRGREAAAVTALAHRFKSSAAVVGAVALARTCQTLETGGRDGDWKQIDRLVDRCAAQFQQVVDSMHADA